MLPFLPGVRDMCRPILHYSDHVNRFVLDAEGNSNRAVQLSLKSHVPKVFTAPSYILEEDTVLCEIAMLGVSSYLDYEKCFHIRRQQVIHTHNAGLMGI